MEDQAGFSRFMSSMPISNHLQPWHGHVSTQGPSSLTLCATGQACSPLEVPRGLWDVALYKYYKYWMNAAQALWAVWIVWAYHMSISMFIQCVTSFQNSLCCVMSCGGGRMEGHWTDYSTFKTAAQRNGLSLVQTNSKIPGTILGQSILLYYVNTSLHTFQGRVLREVPHFQNETTISSTMQKPKTNLSSAFDSQTGTCRLRITPWAPVSILHQCSCIIHTFQDQGRLGEQVPQCRIVLSWLVKSLVPCHGIHWNRRSFGWARIIGLCYGGLADGSRHLARVRWTACRDGQGRKFENTSTWVVWKYPWSKRYQKRCGLCAPTPRPLECRTCRTIFPLSNEPVMHQSLKMTHGSRSRPIQIHTNTIKTPRLHRDFLHPGSAQPTLTANSRLNPAWASESVLDRPLRVQPVQWGPLLGGDASLTPDTQIPRAHCFQNTVQCAVPLFILGKYFVKGERNKYQKVLMSTGYFKVGKGGNHNPE